MPEKKVYPKFSQLISQDRTIVDCLYQKSVPITRILTCYLW